MRRGGKDDDPPVREWLEEPPRGWGDEYGVQDYGAYGADRAGGYGGRARDSGYRHAPSGYGAADYRGRGYEAPDDDAPTQYGAVERYVPPRFGNDDYGAGRYGSAGAPVDYPRRRHPGEEYIPRRAANEPARRADSDTSRRALGAGPGRAVSRFEADEADEPVARRRPPASGKSKRKRKQMPLWQEMPLLLVVAFCLAVLIRTFLVQAFFIPSGSMTDTLLVGDRVLVNKVVYDMRDPRRGEIVVFSGTDSWVPEVPPEPNLGFMAKLGRTVGDLVGVSRPGDKDFIKRVIGLPGDRVSCCDAQGRVQVNGHPLDEPYVKENSPLDVPPTPGECRARRFAEITVKPGQMFVMGDHRLVSQDGRCQGPVPIKNVIGKAFIVVWPKESWATLPMPSTFDDVPPPTAAAAPSAVPGGSATGAPTGIFGIIMPILLALAFPARTGRNFPGIRRRLAE